MNSIKKNKILLVKKLTNEITTSEAFFAFKYHDLSVTELQLLRNELHEQDAKLTIYKNRLVKLAGKNTGFEEFATLLLGPNAFVSTKSNGITAIKTVAAFAKKHKSVVFTAGILDQKPLNQNELTEVSLLPTLEEARQQLSTTLIYPLINISVALNMLVAQKENLN